MILQFLDKTHPITPSPVRRFLELVQELCHRLRRIPRLGDLAVAGYLCRAQGKSEQRPFKPALQLAPEEEIRRELSGAVTLRIGRANQDTPLKVIHQSRRSFEPYLPLALEHQIRRKLRSPVT